jgi:Bacterial Ig-like domain (group 1)
MTMFKRIASLLLISLVAACGGSGDGGTSLFGGGGTTPKVTASNLVLQLDRASVGNSGSESVTVTVTATDASNNVVASAPVTVAADANAVVVAGSSTTDASGKVVANVLVGSENRSNRTVTVTVTSGTVVKTATFQVIGAKLVSTIVGSPFDPSEAGQVIYVLKDVNANPMPNQAITVTGIGGAVAIGTTDATGAFVYSFTAPAAAGDYPITAEAGGDPRPDTIKVAAASTVLPVPAGSILSASVSANPSVVSVNTTATNNQAAIRALFLGANNAPIKDVRVRFDLAGDVNSIGGTFTTGSTVVYSDASGQATTAYVSGSRFSPTDGVTVRACYGYTDAEVAGTNCTRSATATLTVVSEAISVSIGTNRRLIDNTLTYIQEFVVTVVDSSGRAKPDVQITPSIDLLRFGKGQWIKGTTSGWGLTSGSAPQYFWNVDRTFWYLEDPRSAQEKIDDPTGVPLINSAAACWNEDRNRNGVLEAAEDSKGAGYSLAAGGNGNSKLDPAKSDVAISIPGSSRTDSAGKVTVRIEYAKNLGSWLEYKILASASGVGGTEGRATWTDVLDVLASDVKADVEPPFSISRYGILPDCANSR